MSLARSTFLLRASLVPMLRNAVHRPVSIRRAIVQNDFVHGDLPYRRLCSNVDTTKTIDDKKLNANSEISVALPNGKHRIMTLQEAQKYARKQNCDLIDVWNEAEQRTLYCLLSKPGGIKNKELGSGEKQPPKRMKLFSIMTNISEQDLLIKCRKLIDLLKHEKSIRISVWVAESIGKKSTQTQAQLIATISKQVEGHGKVQVLNPDVKVGAVKVIIRPTNTKGDADS